MPSIYFEERGSGPDLVLIHGFCENRTIWDQFAASLSGVHVVMPDLPGFGKSPLPPTPFSIEDAARTMLSWLDEMKFQRPVIIGHSLGGYVTLAMAHLQPKKFAGIGLFHSTAAPDSEEKKENREKVIEFVTRHGVEPFVETFVPGLFRMKNHHAIQSVHAIAMQTQKETLVAYAAAMRDRPDRREVLSTYSRPILLIAGKYDAIIPVDQSEAQVALMKHPQFCVLERAAHMGMFEDEKKAAEVVRNFVMSSVDFQS